VLVLCQGRIAADFVRSQSITDEALFAAASPAVATLPIAAPGAVFA